MASRLRNPVGMGIVSRCEGRSMAWFDRFGRFVGGRWVLGLGFGFGELELGRRALELRCRLGRELGGVRLVI